MRPLILCLERLDRITDVLDRCGGSLSLRDLCRSFRVEPWEVEQAAALGWVELEKRKPRTGRPSMVARKSFATRQLLTQPPLRRQLGTSISLRHWFFAENSILAIKRSRGSFLGGRFGLICFTEAYQRAYRGARSRRGASASVSRLLHHPNVRAARAWYIAKSERRVPPEERPPETAAAVWARLKLAGGR
jgi:hypothetical protein